MTELRLGKLAGVNGCNLGFRNRLYSNCEYEGNDGLYCWSKIIVIL